MHWPVTASGKRAKGSVKVEERGFGYLDSLWERFLYSALRTRRTFSTTIFHTPNSPRFNVLIRQWLLLATLDLVIYSYLWPARLILRMDGWTPAFRTMDNVARLQDNYFRWKFPCYGAESFYFNVGDCFFFSLISRLFSSHFFFFSCRFSVILETGDMVSHRDPCSYIWRILNIQNKRKVFMDVN